MTRLRLGRCERERATGTAPDWVHLMPLGRMTARDGRVFDLAEPEKLVAAFAAGDIDLAIDYEHATERDDARGQGAAPTAGWIKELAVREDGLWGRVEWTARARQMIGAREYRFISPTFNYEEATKRVVKLLGAGLVHRPALHLSALASEDPTMADPVPFLEQLAGLMGLDPEVDEAAVLQAVRDMLAKDEGAGKATASARQNPDPARFVPIDTVRAMLAERNVTLGSVPGCGVGGRARSLWRSAARGRG